MLFLQFVTLFVSVTSAVPLESQPLAKHPSIETLNAFSVQVGNLADELTKWNGQRWGVESIIRHGKEAVATLHIATTQMIENGDVDYWSSGMGFTSAGMAISSKTHSFATAVQAKLPLFKKLQQQQPVFLLLDDAYTEATAFFTASKLKMPTVVYSLLKPFHAELLGTLAEAREAFRPSQEVVVVVVDNGPGQPPSTFTLAGGASMPTGRPLPPGPGTQSSPQQGQQQPSRPGVQLGPRPLPQYTPPAQYNPEYAAKADSPVHYTQYTPQFAQAPDHTQYTQYTPQTVAQATTRPTFPALREQPQQTGYAWFVPM